MHAAGLVPCSRLLHVGLCWLLGVVVACVGLLLSLPRTDFGSYYRAAILQRAVLAW